MENVLYVPSTKFITFDTAGIITSIGNTKPDVGNYIEVDYTQVSKLLSGEESTFLYEVIFNTLTRSYTLIKKTEEKEQAYSFLDDFYEISQTQKVFDLKITQDNNNNFWEITIDSNLADALLEKSLYADYKTFFSITDYNDPFVLRQYIVVDFYKMLIEKTVVEPFNKNIVTNKKYSIYTKRMFEKYSYEVINE